MAGSRVIGIDASRIAVERLTGTETYTLQLLQAIGRIAPSEDVELYLNSKRPPSGVSLPGNAVCIPFPRLWTHIRLSAEVARRRPSVLFIPAHVVPLVHPRTVVTIHDLGYLSHPDAHPTRDLRMLDLTTRWSARAAARVIAISAATKHDLMNYYGVPTGKIDVIHHGVSTAFRPAGNEEIARVRARYNLPNRYLLSVGTVQPRKNFARLAAAVALLNRDGLELSLVIAGKPGWTFEQVERDLVDSGAGDAVRMLGYVEDADLPALYSGATVYCQPSLYEGFGMPLLEAMACGVPVFASRGSALTEVGGDAVLYHELYDPVDMATGLRRIVSDDTLRTEMIAKGTARAAAFTWDRCAEQTLAVLRSVRDR